MKTIRLWSIFGLFVAFALGGAPVAGQGWEHYGGDAGGMQYSSLKLINKRNVDQLQVAWVFDHGEVSRGDVYPTRSAFEATPILVDGVLYVTSPFSHLFALDPETGAQLWDFDPKIDRTMRANLFANRGVESWKRGDQTRIFLGDLDGRIYSLDPRTRALDPDFGNAGVLDLARDAVGESEGRYALTSPVAACGDVIVVGGMVSDGRPQGPSGDVLGLDAASGRTVWRFHTVPRPGETGHDTWEGDSLKGRGGVNAWSILSVDEERQMVFLPLTSPSYDMYGADRPGANLFGNSIVALDCRTGERKWHFQTVHHDLWDWDLPAQPALVEVVRDGKTVPAVAQVTKQGFVFVLNRETGEPLFEVEERPVPPSPVPGEKSWPTQPHPVLPPPVARQTMSLDGFTDVTPESRAECLQIARGAEADTVVFNPITERPTILFPGLNGGSDWGTGAFDPETDTLYVNSMDVGGIFRLVERPPESEIGYALRSLGYEFFWDKNRLPCQKPPWGSLTAVDLNRGTFNWRVTLGEYKELTAQGIPPTGAPNIGGAIVTAGGLVFIGATNDHMFRAFDKDTGQVLWKTELPASGMATPMTYVGPKSGRQFVAIAAGGGNKYDDTFSGKLVVFALPAEGAW